MCLHDATGNHSALGTQKKYGADPGPEPQQIRLKGRQHLGPDGAPTHERFLIPGVNLTISSFESPRYVPRLHSMLCRMKFQAAIEFLA